MKILEVTEQVNEATISQVFYEMLNNYQETMRNRKIATPVPLPADRPIRRRRTTRR